ncbi:MAG: hypothetical protein A2Y20_00040 [Firmicutes bacterium GWF2_51_9]|nr:MAG: hypothetical protein A2Y20_00040 [Firmicutes bacterium GWF2_51_9]OGS59065.1 MAG: hypothetical protein A2Y19_04700 [Firmicutes bacterium GWE2_51_13]HAM64131.1 hypothetical protein [Erysipelotrichaceae bacterium]HBZ40710.1 hypothetical protein [Erysipelotrichaceae bacterium]
MERYTHKSADNQRYILDVDRLIQTDEGYFGDAIALLGRFEDFYQDLILDQKNISNQLEALRMLEKTKTLRYRELFTQKLINQSILLHLEKYGLKEE